MPLPEPLVGIATAIHGALLAALHAQSAVVEMLTVCGPPAAGAVSVSGATVALQPLSCETVNVWPAAVIVPLRLAPEFGAAANCTDPGPFPLAPDVTLIHPALATAVHAHDAFVFTLNDAPPPAAGIACELVGEREYEHPLACTTVYVCPAIVAVPRRSASGFAATVICTVPFPDPLPPEEIPSQGALLTAVHAQPDGLVTSTDTGPPPLATFWLGGAMEYVHPALWVTVNVCPPAVSVPVRCGPVLAAAV